MFSPGEHQYRLDQQRREHLLKEARREQLLRKAVTSMPKSRHAMTTVLLQLWHAVMR